VLAGQQPKWECCRQQSPAKRVGCGFGHEPGAQAQHRVVIQQVQLKQHQLISSSNSQQRRAQLLPGVVCDLIILSSNDCLRAESDA
jgi:hypothetical protein